VAPRASVARTTVEVSWMRMADYQVVTPYLGP